MGWWASDTAALYFDDVRVPAANLIGEENQGFKAIMHNFNYERLGMSAGALGFAQTCLDEATAYARGAPYIRQTADRKPGDPPQAGGHGHADQFGCRLSGRSDLARHAGRAGGGRCLYVEGARHGSPWNSAPNEAVQILGGAGYMRGGKVERIYRETKVMAIGGGSAEIMKDLAARQMAL